MMSCLGALLTLPAFAQESPSSDVKPGRVEGTHYVGKTPAAHEEVILIRQGDMVVRPHSSQVLTDASGRFVFENVPPGDYTLTVDVQEYGVHHPGKPAAQVGHKFAVPPSEDGAVLDLGAVKARMRQYPDTSKSESE